MNSPIRTEGVLIIGYGNRLRGDDGAGYIAARQLAGFGFDTIETEQLTPEIAERIAAARVIFFIDADATLPEGEIAIRQIAGAPSAPVSPMEHHATPDGILRLASVAFSATPEAWSVGIGCRCFDFVEELSQPAQRAVACAVAEILKHTREAASTAVVP
jgi:hydrogenase maturation protease